MADEAENAANAKFVDEDFEEALKLYTKAIGLRPTPRLYSSRSSTHTRLGNYKVALQDASKAISLDPKYSTAYLRRGIAYFYLEDFASARKDFIAGLTLDPKNTSFNSWIGKCNSNLKDDESETNQNGNHKSNSRNESELDTNSDTQDKESSSHISPSPTPQPSISISQPRFRHEWFQSPDKVVVTVFAKNIRSETIDIQFGEQILSFKINQTGSEFSMVVRLFDKIIPDQCKLVVMSTKIEIRLIKAEQVHWKALEYVQNQSVKQPVNISNENAKPSYPSSKKTVDWDKLEATVKKEEKEEKLEGDAALNKLFQDIYANADEDTRRAMNKSFVESNGSVLSTNWKEVGSKKIDPYK